jgi:catechol 2,3-dioxygenase-like lactoylglutathione lyase family enzyme
MESTLGHIQINVRGENLSFYKEVMTFLGWPTWLDEPNIFGVGDKNGASVWFMALGLKDVNNDYDGPGMNHLGLAVGSSADVDATAAHLREQGIALLFETPRHRPEFASGHDSTYYQVMFESPDKVLFEVVYTGPK